MANSFELRANARQQQMKEHLDSMAASAPAKTGRVGLPAPKPKRKQCSLYLDTELMDQVKQVAHRRDVTIGAVIETCVKIALKQLEE